MGARFLALAACLWGAAHAAAVARPAAISLQPTGKWEVDHADTQCVLRRLYAAEDGSPYLFLLPVVPLRITAYLRLNTKAKDTGRKEGEALLSRDSSGGTAPLAYGIWNEGDLRIRQFTLPGGPADLTPAEDRISFDTGANGRVSVKVTGIAAATKALEACMADLHDSLGIDAGALAVMAREPEGDALDFVRWTAFGSVFEFTAFYWVGVDGRVDDCRLLKASGNKDFDFNFCTRLKAAGRFRPARDVAGKPMRAPRFEDVVLRRAVVTTTFGGL